ncbi:MAG: hypothetical protein AMXMBFR13_40300 [Phycisphaerae bacterium]
MIARLTRVLALLGGLVLASGCQTPRRLETYPPGALPVPYEAATTYSSCLLASTAMAANYTVDALRFSEKQMLADFQHQRADVSRVGEVKRYLKERGLHLMTVEGGLDGPPPRGLRDWLTVRRYPVICVINREGADPAFNHAVVVIGVSSKADAESSDTIYYLDPSTQHPLHACTPGEFEELWSRGGHAMMVVLVPPREEPGVGAEQVRKKGEVTR